jgi:hypothetical protein
MAKEKRTSLKAARKIKMHKNAQNAINSPCAKPCAKKAPGRFGPAAARALLALLAILAILACGFCAYCARLLRLLRAIFRLLHANPRFLQASAHGQKPAPASLPVSLLACLLAR